jgi:hypothetical protein
MTPDPSSEGESRVAIVAEFVWQPWVFLLVFIGLPIVLAVLLARK